MINIERYNFLTVQQAAQRMGVSRQTIYSWINDGLIKTIRTPGGRLRIQEDQLMVIEKQPEIINEGDDEHYQIKNISGRIPDLIEQMGTKEKYWFLESSNDWYWDYSGDRFLFKSGREATGENWAEKIAAELCDLLDLPHADYHLAKYYELMGVITPSFVPDGARFVPGNEILAATNRQYEKTKRYKQREHTLRTVAKYLGSDKIQLPIGLTITGDIKLAIDVFVGYIMLDTWMANTDRHPENWGVIFNPSDGTISLAPTFDHASTLGRELTDETKKIGLETKDKGRTIERYIERGRSALYLTPTSSRPMLTIDALDAIAHIRPSAALFWQNRLKNVLVSDTISIIDKIPDELITQTSKKFAIRLLELNRERILNLEIVT